MLCENPTVFLDWEVDQPIHFATAINRLTERGGGICEPTIICFGLQFPLINFCQNKFTTGESKQFGWV